jgi:hypothetical protein
MFQLFKSQSLELNDFIGPEERGLQFMDRCRTDDVRERRHTQRRVYLLRQTQQYEGK